MNTLVEENYLKTIFLSCAENGEVNMTELSKKLGIKIPTVTSMMKKLSDKKLVHYESYKPIKLTEKGKKEAAIIIRKHRLTEMYLVKVMGFGWEEVHEIAEQLEHVHAANFFDKMDEILGFPTIDPHGSPIPDKNGKMIWKQYTKLSDCKVGDEIKITAVLDSSLEFLNFLNNKNLKLGIKIKVISLEEYDKSMLVNYNQKKEEMLSHTVCERLLGEVN